MKKLKNQTAIVTGSSSGIGMAIARALGQEGANVVVTYHSHKDEAEKLAAEIKDRGSNAIAVGVNVGDEESVKALFSETISTFGKLDILVSNSGIQKDSAFVDMSLEEWNKVINTNLTGAFLCAREASKVFLKQGIDDQVSKSAGKIVFISSVHEVIPWAGHANYAAAKGGIMLLMKSMAQELAPEKIRVNSIGPGAIKTPINEDTWKDPEKAEKLLDLIPYKRIGESEDVAKVAAWLCSDDAEYINGTTLFVDGGMTVYPGFAHGG